MTLYKSVPIHLQKNELVKKKKRVKKKYMKHSSTVISSQLNDLCIQL